MAQRIHQFWILKLERPRRFLKYVSCFFFLFFRLVAADLLAQVDRNLSTDDVAQSCGATASVAILHSLDAPATPFFSAQRIALTVAHCG